MASKVHYVILAAGEARRMGFDKTVCRSGGYAPLERIAQALGRRESVVVVPERLRPAAASMMPRAMVVVNRQPWRGMSYSLRTGLEALRPGEAFGVLLGDMPAMTHETIARTEAVFREEDADVAYPVADDGKPGHPVLFSPGARSIVEMLPDGDTLRQARDHRALRRASWVCADRSAFFDLDVPSDWKAFADA